jgi:hypothetical protein
MSRQLAHRRAQGGGEQGLGSPSAPKLIPTRALPIDLTVMLMNRRPDKVNISDASHPLVPPGLIHSFFLSSHFPRDFSRASRPSV